MVLDSSYAGFIVTLASIAVSLGLWFLATRLIRKFDPSGSLPSTVFALLALSSGVVGGVILWNSFTSRVIEISSGSQHEYVIIGNIDYTASDGQIIPIEYSKNDYYILNITDEEMVEDYVSYGLGIDFGYVTSIPGHSFDTLGSRPEYYPWQEPPNQVESIIKMDSRLWIRHTRRGDQYTHE